MIILNDTTLNVSSYRTSASTSTSYTVAPLSSFTYTTGGSLEISVERIGTGTSLRFSFPYNITDQERTGYAYLTLYDTNHDSFQETVTVVQDAAGNASGTSALRLSETLVNIPYNSPTVYIPIISEGVEFGSFEPGAKSGDFNITGTTVGDTVRFRCGSSNYDTYSAKTGVLEYNLYDTSGNTYPGTFTMVQGGYPSAITAMSMLCDYFDEGYFHSGSTQSIPITTDVRFSPAYLSSGKAICPIVDFVAEVSSDSTPGLLTPDWVEGPVYNGRCFSTTASPRPGVGQGVKAHYHINPTIDGDATLIVRDRVSGLEVSHRYHNHLNPVLGEDVFVDPDSILVSSAATSGAYQVVATIYDTSGGTDTASTPGLGSIITSGATDWGVNPADVQEGDDMKVPYISGYRGQLQIYHVPLNTGGERSLEYLVALGDGSRSPNMDFIDTWFDKVNLAQSAPEKDIEIAEPAFEIESGSSTTSIQVGSSGCTYSGFSYTTGGSFSVTATTGVGSAIVFSFPENDTPVARTGYAYMTYYDTDGNTYQQTITVTQEPASDDPEGTSISHPVNGHFVPGMLKLRTTIEDGKVYTTGNASLYPGLGYYKQVKCAPYILYYLNSYGGWDAFVIEGTVIKRDSITSYMTDRSYKNTTLQFETNKYTNEIKTSYELNTGLLSDEESANVAKNLVGSLKVYMHNLQEGWIKPVIITDSSVTYQTYETNGKKLSQYRINITLSQSKLRK